MIDWLESDLPPHFPDTNKALQEPNGLLAAGGCLNADWLIAAYRRGIFPWFEESDPILWWSPAPRAVITRDSYRKPRTVEKILRRNKKDPQGLTFTCNQDFDRVMFECSQPRDGQAGSWITHDMMQAYQQLHQLNIAQCVECWDAHGNLVGGFYGVLIGQAFFGESMFSRVSNASKLCFAHFADLMFEQGLTIIDCQMYTDHLAQFGAQEMSRKDFEGQLEQAIVVEQTIQLPGFLD